MKSLSSHGSPKAIGLPLVSLHAFSDVNEQFFYSVHINEFGGMSFEEINARFSEKRALRQIQYDFLGVGGNLIYEKDNFRIITGADSSKKIVFEVFGVKMKLIRRKKVIGKDFIPFG